MLTSKYLLPLDKMTNSFLMVYPIITRVIILSSDSSVHLSIGFIVRQQDNYSTFCILFNVNFVAFFRQYFLSVSQHLQLLPVFYFIWFIKRLLRIYFELFIIAK